MHCLRPFWLGDRYSFAAAAVQRFLTSDQCVRAAINAWAIEGA